MLNTHRTEWFPHCENPYWIGVYERYIAEISTTLYAYWDGEQWYAGTSTPEKALWNFHTELITFYPKARWRGLVCS